MANHAKKSDGNTTSQEGDIDNKVSGTCDEISRPMSPVTPKLSTSNDDKLEDDDTVNLSPRGDVSDQISSVANKLRRVVNEPTDVAIEMVSKSKLGESKTRPSVSSRKRERTRKTPKPKKRLNYIVTHTQERGIPQSHNLAPEGNENIQPGHSSSNLSHNSQTKPALKTSKQLQKSQVKVDKSKETANSKEKATHKKTQEDEEKYVKIETLHGYVVEDWCDLGPSLHQEGHSPLCSSSTNITDLEVKESPGAGNRKCIRLGDSEQATSTTETREAGPGNSGYDTGRDIPSLGQKSHQSKKPLENVPYEACHPFPVPIHSFFPDSLPSTASAYRFPFQPFPLPLHTPTSASYPAQTSSGPLDANTCRLVMPESIFATGLTAHKGFPMPSYPYAISTSGPFSKENCPENLGPETENSSKQIFNNSLLLASADSTTACARGENVSQGQPDTSMIQGPSALIGGLPYPKMIYRHDYFQPNPVQGGGMLVVPPQPYIIQQVPFIPYTYAQSINHPSTQINPPIDLSSSTNTPTGQDCKDDTKSQTIKFLNNAIFQLGTAHGMAAGTLKTECDINQLHDISKYQALPTQPPTRLTLKPKMTGAKDFIDPTRIKFGLDDEDTDEEMSRLRDGNNSSDEDWQPKKKHREHGNDRYKNESGNGSKGESSSATDDEAPAVRHREAKGARKRRRSTRGPVKCPDCGKLFQGEYHLRRHQMSHSDERPYECQICKKRFKQKAHLMGHQTVHDRALKRVKDEVDADGKKGKQDGGNKGAGRPRKAYTEVDLSCKECGKSFKTLYRLKRHEQSHTDIRPFTCKICGKGFKQTGHRNEHQANHEKTKKQFLCNMCGVVFRCRSSFNNHMKSHGTEKLRLQQIEEARRNSANGEVRAEMNEVSHTGYDCPYCVEKFATAQALNSHLDSHIEIGQRRHVQPYNCDICRRAFTYRHNLLKHKLIHKAPEKFAQFHKEKIEAHVASGKPSFKCNRCSKIFIRKETLAKHYKIHSGTKPFKCTICSRAFTQNVHLKVHMRKHTGSRPFQCKECSRSFIDSTALAKHIEYEACNADNSLYHCKICDKRHFYLGSIKQHIRRNHNMKEEEVEACILKTERVSRRRSSVDGDKHFCRICSWTFSEKCNLVRHIKRKHFDLYELLQRDIDGKVARVYSNLNSNNRYCAENVRSTSRNCGRFLQGLSDQKSCNDSDDRDEDNCPGQLMIDESEVGGSFSDVGVSRTSQRDLNAVGNESKSLEFEAVNSRLSPQSLKDEDSRVSLLEGFHTAGFSYIENHSPERCSKDSSFSLYRQNGSVDSINTYASPYHDSAPISSECKSLESKLVAERPSSSPTDINFLYNIGLIVSNRAKKPKSIIDEDISDEVFVSEKEVTEQSCNTFKCQDTRPASPVSETNDEFQAMVKESCLTQNMNITSSCSPQLVVSNLLSQPETYKHLSNKENYLPSSERDGCMIQSLDDKQPKNDRQELAPNDKTSELEKALKEMPMEKKEQAHVQSTDMNVDVDEDTVSDQQGQKTYGDKGIIFANKAIKLNYIESGKDVHCHDETCKFKTLQCNIITEEKEHNIPSGGKQSANQSQSASIDSPGSKKILTSLSPIRSKMSPQQTTSPHTSETCPSPADKITTSEVIHANTTKGESTLPTKKGPMITTPYEVSTDFCSAIESTASGLVEPSSTSNSGYNASLSRTPSQGPVESKKSTSTHMEENAVNQLVSDQVHSHLKNDQSTHNEPSKTKKCITESTESKVLQDDDFHPEYKEKQPITYQKNTMQSHTSYIHTLPHMNTSTTVLSEKPETITSVTSDILPDDMKRDYPLDHYEACPTESHIRQLGLLACKDARDIKSRSFPLEERYSIFKPWLEEIFVTSRLKRGRVNDASAKSKDKPSSEAAVNPDAEAKIPSQSIELLSGEPSSDISLKFSKDGAISSLSDETGIPKRQCKTRKVSSPRQESRIFRSRKRSARKMMEVPPVPAIDVLKQVHYLQQTRLLRQLDAAISAGAGIPRQTTDIGGLGPDRTNFSNLTNQSPSVMSSSMSTRRSPVVTRAELSARSSKLEGNDATKATAVRMTATTTTSSPDRDDGGGVGTNSVTAATSPPTTPDSTVRGKRQFPCVVCNKVFTARHQLRRHEMTHTDHRPYSCDNCGKRFRQKVHLSDHVKRHQGQRPFVCAGCGKRFVLKNEMNQHIKNHCKGTRDTFQSGTSSSEKNIFTISLTELQQSLQPLCDTDSAHLQSDNSTMTQPVVDKQKLMTLYGQHYRTGDYISNGMITLRVVDSSAEGNPPCTHKPTATQTSTSDIRQNTEGDNSAQAQQQRINSPASEKSQTQIIKSKPYYEDTQATMDQTTISSDKMTTSTTNTEPSFVTIPNSQ